MEMKIYKVKAPDGQIIQVRGPVGASQDEVFAQAKRLVAEKQTARAPQFTEAVPTAQESSVNDALAELAKEQGPIDAFLIGAGRGFYNIGRGLGLADQASETEQKAYEALSSESPVATTVGEVVGESAPFVIPGAGAGKIATLAPRAATMAGLGAAQGAISSRGRGQDLGDQVVSGAVGGTIAGGLELALPYIGRAAGALVRRVSGREPAGALLDAAGRPTAELQEALKKAGMNFDELSGSVIQQLKATTPGAVPEQAARAALFAQEGIPATAGNVTKDFGQEAVEQRLAQSSADTAAQPFRATVLEQSEKFKGKLDELVGQLGVSDRAGESLKGALLGQKKLMSAEKNRLYNEAAAQAKDIGGLPIFPDEIRSAIPDANKLEDLAITSPAAIESLDKALVKYGIKEAPEGYKGGLTPLTVENFESFRKLLNNIERSDTTGASSVAIGPIKNALDTSFDTMVEGINNPGLRDKLVEARGIVRGLKTDFSPQALAGKLIDVKRDGVTEVVEASKVIPALLSKATPIEQLQKTMAQLSKGGEKGKQAIGDMQAAAVMKLLDDSFGATSRTIDGVKTLGPGAYQKSIKDIGDAKLNLLFSNNKSALNQIRNLEKISAAIQPDGGAVPKGSSNALLDLAQKGMLSRIPVFGQTIQDIVSIAKQSGDTGREVAKALNAKPEVAKMASMINRDYPQLAAALGIAGFVQSEE